MYNIQNNHPVHSPGGGWQRIVWLYDGNHLKNPILQQAAYSLFHAGYQVTVIDRAPKTIKRRDGYRHISCPFAAPNSYQAGTCSTRTLALRSQLFFSWMFTRALSCAPQVCLTSLPTAAWVGAKVKQWFQMPLAYYPFELFGEQNYDANILWIEREKLLLANSIDILFTQNQQRANIYVQERGFPNRPILIHNYKPYQRVRSNQLLRKQLHASNTTRIVLYEGVLIPGRGLFELARASNYLPEDCRLVLMGHGQRKWLEGEFLPFLKRENLQRVTVLPKVPFDQVANYVVDADVGVVIYDNSVRNNLFCEPGKLSDYVLAGVPVICPDYPSIADRVRSFGIGELFSEISPRAIANSIAKVLSQPRENWHANLQKAQTEMVWETQESKFVNAIRDLIRPQRRISKAA